MEAMATFVLSSFASDIHQGDLFASPLLMEQVTAEVNGQLMTPSDALAVLTFVRRPLVMLATEQDDAEYCNLLPVLNQLDSSVTAKHPFPDQPRICFGIRREMSIA